MFWNVRASPSRVRWCGARSSSGVSWKRMPPASAARIPLTQLSSVVLPEPLGPIRAWTAPASTTRSTPSSTRRPPNDFVTPRSSGRATREPRALVVDLDEAAVLDDQHGGLAAAVALGVDGREPGDAVEVLHLRPAAAGSVAIGVEVLRLVGHPAGLDHPLHDVHVVVRAHAAVVGLLTARALHELLEEGHRLGLGIVGPAGRADDGA